MIYLSEEIIKKAEKIRLLLMDVDGVLTDGRIIYDNEGRELKFFFVRDGHGIKLLQKSGVKTGIITGRKSEIVVIRAKELGMDYIFQNVGDKGVIIDKIIEEGYFKPEEIAFIGDDIVDIPVFRKVGFKISVPDASYDIRDEVDYITLNYAGKGAVREVCEIILKAKGLWDEIMETYRFGSSF
ncbi:MAG: HAD family hydrolase [Proteobacteria bacterium]|nr:HAD family hydrolase [Pseudomonadota bacterium]